MGPNDDSVLHQSDKNMNDLEVLCCEDFEYSDTKDDLTR